ncbi:uncharacterized protein LOC143567952 [Bidens hawaiensis]|uniref:uncharacterized protein LOC143567952 n=1 Tax=Bidens hawaiensis TaxID=980011 RepID=UPI00404AD26D
MEQNLPIVAKKVQSLVRTILFMIKKKISRSKLLLDLNIMMKRDKLSGKAYYDFSYKNTLKKHQSYKKSSHNKSVNINESHDQIIVDPSVIKALEMLTITSPVVRQLRVTDSPFPLSNGEDDGYVDEAADKFIMKFYNNLRRES